MVFICARFGLLAGFMRSLFNGLSLLRSSDVIVAGVIVVGVDSIVGATVGGGGAAAVGRCDCCISGAVGVDSIPCWVVIPDVVGIVPSPVVGGVVIVVSGNCCCCCCCFGGCDGWGW